MSQFTTPPGSPGESQMAGYAAPGGSPAPWSAAAVSAFVLALLGCLGITAALGVILGIVGLVRTSGGQRRGRGLAIAAIPISLVLGAICLLAVLASVKVAGHVATLTNRMPDAFAADAATSGPAVDALREICSDEFNESVGPEALQEWIDEVVSAHGRLVEVAMDMTGAGQPGALSLQGKFVSGQANITITLAQGGRFEFVVDDIAVDGLSPREFGPDQETPP